MSQHADAAALLRLLRQTRSLLAAQLDMGLAAYPAKPELRHFLAARRPAPVPTVQLRQPAVRPSQPARQEQAAPQAPVLSLSEISAQIAGCRRCPEAAPEPGQGCAAPRLMVVSDCFVGRERGQGQLLSPEEDRLFWRMMAAIGLSRENVYFTNALKCPQRLLPPLGGGGLPEERACLPWLEAELRAMQPPLICALGETAARMLLGRPTPLLRLRKNFHRCPQLKTALVLATYPPRLLLQHPELKQAAWEDLQLLQKQLLKPLS